MGEELLIRKALVGTWFALMAAGCSGCFAKATPPKTVAPTSHQTATRATPQSASPGPNAFPLDVVRVENNSGISCAATHTVGLLRKHGFKAEVWEDPNSVPDAMRTTLEYPSTQAALAVRVHQGMSGVLLVQTPDAFRITLVIGGNGGVIFGTDISGGFYDCPEGQPGPPTSPSY